jgi:rhodanese-related sulfurtransferase
MEVRAPRDGDPSEGSDTAGVAELLAAARAQIDRLTPQEALAEAADGAALVDIRPPDQRQRDGDLPHAHVVPRNVLEWRLDPLCEHRDPLLAEVGKRVILICDEGYQSSLAAATLKGFGIDAADVVGGVQAWRRAELELI